MSADGTNLGRWDWFQDAGAESARLDLLAEEEAEQEERERVEGPERTDSEADEAIALIAASLPIDAVLARVRALPWCERP